MLSTFEDEQVLFIVEEMETGDDVQCLTRLLSSGREESDSSLSDRRTLLVQFIGRKSSDLHVRGMSIEVQGLSVDRANARLQSSEELRVSVRKDEDDSSERSHLIDRWRIIQGTFDEQSYRGSAAARHGFSREQAMLNGWD